MREQMSAFDIRAAVRELAFLEGSFVDNIYHTRPEELVLRFKVPRDQALEYGPIADTLDAGGGNYVTAELLVRAGGWLHLVSEPVEKPLHPTPFVMKLRRQLGNARAGPITQPGFERIVRLPLSKADEYILVMEMFGDGNIILVKEGTIVLPMRSKTWKARTLKAGEEYLPPPPPADPFSMGDGDIVRIIAASDRDVVRCLAVEVNLGGPYAEEVLRRADVDKKTPVQDLTDESVERIVRSVRAMLDDFERGKGATGIVGEEGGLVEVHPAGIFPAPADGGPTFATFNLAVEAMARAGTAGEVVLPEVEEHVSRLEETRRMVAQQEEAVEKYNEEARSLKRRGDAIYAHYQRCQDIVTNVSEARERLGWDEVAKRLAGSGEGITVDPATGSVTFEVDDDGGPLSLTLDIRLDLNANANRLYEASKKARSRSDGAGKALASTRAKLERLEKAHAPGGARAAEAGAPPGSAGAAAADIAPVGEHVTMEEGADGEGLAPPPRRRTRKRFWFEDYRWFISSEGLVAAGGKDAASNDRVVRKYLDDLDRYAHADVHGASSVVVKSAGGEAPGEATMEEACGFAVIHSRAWEQGHGGGTAYWVLPEQVSKTPQAGEALPRGAFIIRGKRNWLRDLPLLVAVTDVEHEGVRLVMGAPRLTVERLLERERGKEGERRRYVVLAPGPVAKNTAALLLASAFQVTEEEVAGVLPSGGVQLVDAVGMPGAVVEGFMER